MEFTPAVSAAIALALVPVFYYVLFRFLALPLIRLVERRGKNKLWVKILTTPIGSGSFSAHLNQELRRRD